MGYNPDYNPNFEAFLYWWISGLKGHEMSVSDVLQKYCLLPKYKKYDKIISQEMIHTMYELRYKQNKSLNYIANYLSVDRMAVQKRLLGRSQDSKEIYKNYIKLYKIDDIVKKNTKNRKYNNVESSKKQEFSRAEGI